MEHDATVMDYVLICGGGVLGFVILIAYAWFAGRRGRGK